MAPPLVRPGAFGTLLGRTITLMLSQLILLVSVLVPRRTLRSSMRVWWFTVDVTTILISVWWRRLVISRVLYLLALLVKNRIVPSTTRLLPHKLKKKCIVGGYFWFVAC